MLLLPDLLDDIICVSIADRLPDLADLASLAAASRRMRALLRERVQRGHAFHRASLERLAEKLTASQASQRGAARARHLIKARHCDLCSCNIDHGGAAAIAEALHNNGVLNELDISRNQIGPKGATAISEALQGNEVLTELDIGRNNIGPEGGVAIAEALRGNGVLKTLWLARNNIGDEGAVAIADALRVNGVLKSIDLRGNSLGTEGWCAIFAALRDNEKNKIESWELSGIIDVEVAKVLAEYVSVSGALTKLMNLNGHELELPQLRGTDPVISLDLSDERRGPASAIVIASLIAGNGVLTSLNLSSNRICDIYDDGSGEYEASGIVALADALHFNGVLTDLNLSSNNIGGGTGWIQASNVEGESKEVGAKVIFQGREMVVSVGGDDELQLENPTGVIAIAKALEVNGVLKALHLNYNEIGNKGAKALAFALRVNGVLTKLNLDGKELDLPKLRGTDPVKSLDLSSKWLGPASAIVIASLIAGNGVLTELDLSYNDIEATGAEALASALRVNAVLTNLVLTRNHIGDEGAAALATALRVNGVLKILNPYGNNIRDEGAAAIAEALRGNGVLTHLDLGNNWIRHQGAAAIAEALRGNGVL